MKKIILVICDKPSVKKGTNGVIPDQNECKLIIIDTENEKDEAEFPIIKLSTGFCNKLDPEVVNDLLSRENQVYVLLSASGDNLTRQEFLQKNVIRFEPAGFDVKYSLTRQERLILDYLVNGLHYKEIAEKMNRSYHTVKHHIENIFSKMKVNNLCDAVDKYREYKKSMN